MKTSIIALASATTLLVGATWATRLLAPSYTAAFDYQGNDSDEGEHVAIDPFGNIYVAATCLSDSDGQDFVVVKYSSTLTKLWDRKYDGPATGSASDDIVTGIAVDSAGNVFVSGTSRGTSNDDVAIKGWKPDGENLWDGSGFDANGAFRWNSSTGEVDTATDLAIDKNGNLYISGYREDNVGDRDGFVLGLTSAGAMKSGWPVYADVTGKIEQFNAVAVSDDLTVFAGGSDSSVSQTENFMAKIIAGNGSVIQDLNWDYASGTDRIVDVDCNDAHFVASGDVSVASGDTGRLAVVSFTPEDNVPEWTKVTSMGTYSRSGEVTLRNGLVYACGYARISSADHLVAVKLSELTGLYSTTWASSGGYGDGVRVYPNPSNIRSRGTSIFASGDNVYVGGYEFGVGGSPPVDLINDREFLTVAYGPDGTLIVDEIYSNTLETGDEVRDIITGCGDIFVTGPRKSTVNTVESVNVGTVAYGTGVTSEIPENIYVDEGSGTVTITNITSSNDQYGDVLAVAITNPKVTVRFEGTVGTNVSELCFIAETSVDVTGVEQRIELYNFVTQSWVQFDKRTATVDDQTVAVNVRVSPDPYVSNGLVKARIHFDDVGVVGDGFSASFDFVKWTYR